MQSADKRKGGDDAFDRTWLRNCHMCGRMAVQPNQHHDAALVFTGKERSFSKQ